MAAWHLQCRQTQPTDGTGKDLHEAMSLSRWLAFVIVHSFCSSEVGDDWNIQSPSNGDWFFFAWPKHSSTPPPNSSSIHNLSNKNLEKTTFSSIFLNLCFGFPCKSSDFQEFSGSIGDFLIPFIRPKSCSEVGDFSAGVGYIGAIDHLPKVSWWSWWIFRKTHRTHGKTMVEQNHHQKHGRLGLQPQKKSWEETCVCVFFFWGKTVLITNLSLGVSVWIFFLRDF